MKLLKRSCGGGGEGVSSSSGSGSDNQQRRAMRAMTEPCSPREEGGKGPPLAARVHTNQILSQH